MTDTLLQVLVTYGAALMFITAFLSCLAVPIPMSLVMLSGGALAAHGDLSFSWVWSLTVLGALLGDQAGYFLGRLGKPRLEAFAHASYKRYRLWTKAQAHLHNWGITGVFLSRWLMSPLGPYVNFAAGAASMRWAHFSAAGLVGEAIWVTLYVGLGFLFAENLPLATQYAQDGLQSVGAFVILLACTVVIVNISKRRRAVLS
ncbi:DedA family protein [Cognatishimia sp.]|uniref:DedA family protein n=1 Tax=Cognatishimia sp. TaxID=2211648 RepID=UPI0035163C8A